MGPGGSTTPSHHYDYEYDVFRIPTVMQGVIIEQQPLETIVAILIFL